MKVMINLAMTITYMAYIFYANKSTDLVMATHHIIPVDFQCKYWCFHYLITGLDKQKFSA